MGKPGLSATVRVLRMAFFRKVITRHDTGLGEAYMDGDFVVHSALPKRTTFAIFEPEFSPWLHH
jgi:hypothetical protein